MAVRKEGLLCILLLSGTIFCLANTKERDIENDIDEGEPSGIKENMSVGYCKKGDTEPRACSVAEWYFLGSRRNNKCTRKFYFLSSHTVDYDWASSYCMSLAHRYNDDRDMIFQPQVSQSQAEADWVMKVARNMKNYTNGDGHLYVERYETDQICLTVNKTGGENCWTKEKTGECQYYLQASHDDCFPGEQLQYTEGKGYLLCEGVHPWGETEYEKARCKPNVTIPKEQPDVQRGWIRMGKINAYPCRNDSNERYMWLETTEKSSYGVLENECEKFTEKLWDMNEDEFAKLSYSLLEDRTDECMDGLENLFRTWYIERPVVLRQENGTFSLLTWNSDNDKIDVIKGKDPESHRGYMAICVAEKEKMLTDEETDALIGIKKAK